ncbi:MAG TPA: hypothetical protein VK919_00970 [Solirubrobacterales bacterium]|nr:hypothetical protein [Solirubrobacterales bacterium]
MIAAATSAHRRWRKLLTVALVLAAVLAASEANAATIVFPVQRELTINVVGEATPYPSRLQLSGLGGSVTKATVSLVRIQHKFPEDIDALLVGPGGQHVMLMSDACRGDIFVQVTLTLDDGAPQLLPIDDCDPFVPAWRPANYNTEPAETAMPAPAPAGPYGYFLSALTGTSPNGTWRLFVVDDTPLQGGRLRDGWRLELSGITTPVRCAGRTPTQMGTAANDVVGFSGFDPFSDTGLRDVIAGLAGRDRLAGGPKADRLCGGGGRDRLAGGAGRDVLIGGPGPDTLNGGPGRDRCEGGPGKDRLIRCER